MKKPFRSALLFLSLLAFFSIVCPAQTEKSEPILTGQVVAHVGNDKEGALTETRPRVAGDTQNVAVLAVERKVFELINRQRAENNLTPLEWSDEVAKIARLHSENMAKYKFFSHLGQDGLTAVERASSIKWRLIGENIGMTRGFENPAQVACDGWMKSLGHRENLLNGNWQETGIGVAIAADGTYYFTQVFLAR